LPRDARGATRWAECPWPAAPAIAPQGEFVEVGLITKAFGIRGEVKVAPATDQPRKRFVKGKRCGGRSGGGRGWAQAERWCGRCLGMAQRASQPPAEARRCVGGIGGQQQAQPQQPALRAGRRLHQP
jgi:hypothetical protein